MCICIEGFSFFAQSALGICCIGGDDDNDHNHYHVVRVSVSVIVIGRPLDTEKADTLYALHSCQLLLQKSHRSHLCTEGRPFLAVSLSTEATGSRMLLFFYGSEILLLSDAISIFYFHIGTFNRSTSNCWKKTC